MHPLATQVIWPLTLALVAGAAWIDGRTRRIPNWLTVSGFATGLAVHLMFGGWRGGITALEGAGLDC